MDESKGLRQEEEAGRKDEAGGGLQVAVHGEKNKGPSGPDGGSTASDAVLGSGPARLGNQDKADAVPRAKAKVTFHDPTIPRPQEVYSIIVNNNQPFNHAWLERSEDGTRLIHPLEKLPVSQLIDRSVPQGEPAKPPELEDTPFTLVEDLKGLKELAKKLEDVNEFAVDLEHNQYRSFQGLTCLMQISTRTEDFIVDTLKLRIYIGCHLDRYFKDPTKRKVMHGADRDILWLQRDFHIYVCNLFDTGQASRVLKMERNSLEHLLNHFCGVTANKVYQNADWRSRPLSDEMIKYAREDTHYLLYIYDLMRQRLQRERTFTNDLLLEVQKRSNEICLQLYEKELLTDTSYLHIYGLHEHELDAEQLAVVSVLHRWRDYVARQQDESTGYVLPNKALIEIAKKIPKSAEDLRGIVKSKYPFVEDNLDLILEYIWTATENSDSFETIAEELKKERLEQLALKTPLDADNDRGCFDPAGQNSAASSSTANLSVAADSRGGLVSEAALISSIRLDDKTGTISSSKTKTSETLSGLTRQSNTEALNNNNHNKEARTTVQELERPMYFGALVGNSTSVRQTDNFGWFSNEQAQSMVRAEPSSAYYYPQFPEYSSGVGWGYYGPEGMQTSSWSLPGSDDGFQSINQSWSLPGSGYGFQSTYQTNTGTGQPVAGNKEWDSQGPRKQQAFPPPGK